MATEDRHYIAAGRSLQAVQDTLETARLARQALAALRADVGPEAVVYPVSGTLVLPVGAELPDGLRRLRSGRCKAKRGKAGRGWDQRIRACYKPGTCDLTERMFGGFWALVDEERGDNRIPSVRHRALKDGRHLLTMPDYGRQDVEPPDAVPLKASEFWALVEADKSEPVGAVTDAEFRALLEAGKGAKCS